MTQTLPDILFPSADFSFAELSAARLDGELVTVDDGFSPVDQPMTFALRLSSIMPLMGDRLILERRSALWAYGFAPYPPSPHEACVRSGARWRVRDPARMRVREVVIADDEIVASYGVQLTSMLRTAVDIAKTTEQLGETEARQLADLLAAAGATPADCAAQLSRSRNTPNRVRALARLTAALSATQG